MKGSPHFTGQERKEQQKPNGERRTQVEENTSFRLVCNQNLPIMMQQQKRHMKTTKCSSKEHLCVAIEFSLLKSDV